MRTNLEKRVLKGDFFMYLHCSICNERTVKRSNNQKYCRSCRQQLRQQEFVALQERTKELFKRVAVLRRERTEALRSMSPDELLAIVRNSDDGITTKQYFHKL